MLKNSFTTEELAACTPGAWLTCTKTVAMIEDRSISFTEGKPYQILSANSEVLGVTNDLGTPHFIAPDFLREHFSIDHPENTAPREIVHLTETGPNAGRRLCLTDRFDGAPNVHAAYAPLHKQAFRDNVCPACLQVWADDAYQDGDAMPVYIAELRKNGKAVQNGQGDAVQLSPAV